MNRLPIVINGIDFTNKINKYSYSVKYKKVTGPNGGTMQNGDETVDQLGVKPVIRFGTNGMKSEDLAILLKELTETYVMVKFFDTRINDTRRAIFIPTIGESRVIAYQNNKWVWFGETTVTLEGRSCTK